MDKIVYCIKCQKPFVLTEKTQQIYRNKRFPAPKRCSGCLIKRQNSRREEVERQRKQLYKEI